MRLKLGRTPRRLQVLPPEHERQLTLKAVTDLADGLGHDRLRVWIHCPVHDVSTLPRTSDTHQPYCRTCYSVFGPGGEMLNPPDGRDSAK